MESNEQRIREAFSFLPTTHQEFWERWLGWRYPHYDAMESDAARTLTGTKTAVVRLGWDGTRAKPADWHATLFTLAAETIDADATIASVEEHKPVGIVFHHVVTEALPTEAATPPPERAAPLARQIDAALARRAKAAEMSSDPRAVPQVVNRLKAEASEQLNEARAATESAIIDGLEARDGFSLKPVAVLKPDMLESWLLYTGALTIREMLCLDKATMPWIPHGIAVCRSCTTVFRPRRRSTATYCSLCRRRPANGHVFGERPLAPGELQSIRAPKLLGNIIVGWKTVSMGLCVECGEFFMARSDAKACASCAGKARQRRHRERQAER